MMHPKEDTTDAKELLPKWEEIPDEFKKPRNRYVEFVSQWFFEGVDRSRLVGKEGIDEKKALLHVKRCMTSRSVKHEHKEAGCAYLLSLWFDLKD